MSDSFALFVESITKSEVFQNTLNEAVNKALENRQTLTPPDPVLYTRHEVRQMLNISLPTLDRYVKLGILEGKRVGTRILFTRESLESALKTIPIQKFKRS